MNEKLTSPVYFKGTVGDATHLQINETIYKKSFTEFLSIVGFQSYVKVDVQFENRNGG